MPRIPNAPFIRAALATVLVSAAVMLTTLVRAIRVTPVEASENIATAALSRSTATPPVPQIDLDAVGANGLFQPDRSALPYRYRMPGETAPDETPVVEPARPVVLGTVLATDGAHFASVQMPGGRPTTLRVGDQIGGYTIVGIERNKVAFKNAAGTLMEITATRPGTR